jgi:hypothetical protein
MSCDALMRVRHLKRIEYNGRLSGEYSSWERDATMMSDLDMNSSKHSFRPD